MKRTVKLYIAGIALPLAVGALAGWISRDGMEAQQLLNQPPLSPPQWLFPIVWATLYILMGIASVRIYDGYAENRERALLLYLVQLSMNFLWSMFFFIFAWYAFSAAWLLGMIFVIIAMLFQFYLAQKFTAWINVPYLLWCGFALYLNIGIFMLN